MTIASEIERIKTNIANTYNALGEKGATMPEILNSANLADTVATVTTGGGGGTTPVYNTKYSKYMEYLDTWIGTDRTVGQVLDMGFTRLSGGKPFYNTTDSDKLKLVKNYGGNCVSLIAFNKNALGVTFDVDLSSIMWLKFGTSIHIDYDNAKMTINDLDDAYIAAIYSNWGLLSSMNFVFAPEGLALNNTFVRYHMPRYMSFAGLTYIGSTVYTKENKYNDTNAASGVGSNIVQMFGWGPDNGLDRLYLSNIKFGGSISSLSYIPKIMFGFGEMSYDDLAELHSDIIAGETTVSVNTSYWFDFNYPYQNLFMHIKDCPLVFDISNISNSTGEFYVGGYLIQLSGSGAQWWKRPYPPANFFFIPNASWDIYWTSYVGMSGYSPISAKSLEVFGKVCPSVSNKKFVIGEYTLAQYRVTHPQLLEVIESKGYVLS